MAKKRAIVPTTAPPRKKSAVAQSPPPAASAKKKSAFIQRDPEQVIREKLISFRGATALYPQLFGTIDLMRKERFADWMLQQPPHFLYDLSEVLAHLSQHGQEAVFLASMLRTLIAHRRKTGT